MRHLTTIAAAFALAGSLALTAPATAATTAAAPTIELKPGALPRGDDFTGLHLDGHHTIVDGDRSVHTDARLQTVLGRSGQAWIATSGRADGSRPRLLRIRPDGTTRTLLRGPKTYDVRLSSDGERVFSVHIARFGVSSRVRVFDARTSDLDADRTFDGSVGVLEANGDRVLLGGWGPNRTFRWNLHTDTTRRIVNRVGYAASVADDLLATYTRDPYLGGCTVVSTLAKPGQTLWKSCKERVVAFAPGGQWLATIHILSDGIGPSQVNVRTYGGQRLASYTASWFGTITWEDATHLALFTNGKKHSAWVRCKVDECERASDLKPVQEL